MLLLALLLVIVFMTGCLTNGGDDNNVNTDATVHSVSSTIPADLATGAAINGSISATFSERMNPAAKTAATFVMKQGSMSIPAVVTYSGSVATINPTSDLAPNTIYSVTILMDAGDQAGQTTTVDKTWSFTTGTESDNTAPTVSSTIPANLEAAVPVNVSITATFSEGMDPATVTTASFVLKQGETPVPCNVTYIDTIATLNPTSNLTSNTRYTASINKEVHDLADNALTENKTWSFTTGTMSDNTLPSVSFTDPAAEAISVAVNGTISATFSEPMNPATISTATFSLKQGTMTVPCTVKYAGNIAILNPTNYLSTNTNYTAMITMGARDLADNALACDCTWNFQTAATSANYTVYEYSPVFTTLIPDQGYVLKDNFNYKLYYAGNDFASINLAQSPDGMKWTPYNGNPVISDAKYHSEVKYYDPGFPGADSGTNPSALLMNYRIWYQGLNGNSIEGWRYAESQDGINWYNRMPVTQFGTPVFSSHTETNYGIADAVYLPGASNSGTDWLFRIYAVVQWGDAPYAGKQLVIMAFSSNGYSWTGYDPASVGYATPVFAGMLNTNRFDCEQVGWFKVIKNSQTDWQAFYSGGNGTKHQASDGIGYATSTDGIYWIRRKTLFNTSDGVAWRNQSVWMPSVVKTGNNYQVYFLGSDNPNINSDLKQWEIGWATLSPQ